MLQINGKTFMNLQEAVQWLLDNNALPFQSSANYVANTEIGLGTIVNPSPAKVRIGSLIFFADSKVSTVIGLTENGFMVSDQYNDLVDDVVYVSNVQLNASGHLIVTLSNGDQIDAGLIKQVSGFSINASQHLIASYNDGTSTDLGAIFNGNVTISGSLTVSGGITTGAVSCSDIIASGNVASASANVTGTVNANAVHANEILESMSGYSLEETTSTYYSKTKVYVGAVKTGNKLTLVVAYQVTKTDAGANSFTNLCNLVIPASIYNKLFPVTIGGSNVLDNRKLLAGDDLNSGIDIYGFCYQLAGNKLYMGIGGLSSMVVNTTYYVRYELTFLLSDPLTA